MTVILLSFAGMSIFNGKHTHLYFLSEPCNNKKRLILSNYVSGSHTDDHRNG